MLIVTAFVSCSKESSGPSTNNITGTWTFVSMDVNTSTIQEYNDGSGTNRSVSSSNYTTENNTGTVVIDASTMSSNNLSYSVNTTMKSDLYYNGVLQTSNTIPFTFTAPVSSGSSTYRTINADSVYFESGSIFMNDASQQTIPTGARLNMEGNTLYMTTSIAQTSTEVIFGISMKTDINITTRVKLQRQ